MSKRVIYLIIFVMFLISAVFLFSGWHFNWFSRPVVNNQTVGNVKKTVTQTISRPSTKNNSSTTTTNFSTSSFFSRNIGAASHATTSQTVNKKDSNPASIGSCYQGMSLPASFTAFDTTFWRRKISGGVGIDANSEGMINKLAKATDGLTGSFTNWTWPIHVVKSANCSPKKVYLTEEGNGDNDPDSNQVVENVPIPAEAWADPKEDSHLVIVDPWARLAWEMSGARKKSDGSWQASRLQKWDLDGAGHNRPWQDYWWTFGVTGSGLPLIAGVIRPEELVSGEINHALIFSAPTNRKNIDGGKWPEFCVPASRSDGAEVGADYLPEGARLQLDPTLDLGSLGLSREGKIIAEAMQVYGLYDGDDSPTFKIYFQNLGQKWPNQDVILSDLQKIPVSAFRVLGCQISYK